MVKVTVTNLSHEENHVEIKFHPRPSPYISAAINLAMCRCPTRDHDIQVTGDGPGRHWYTASVHHVETGTVNLIEILTTPDKAREHIAVYSIPFFWAVAIHWIKPGRRSRYLTLLSERKITL